MNHLVTSDKIKQLKTQVDEHIDPAMVDLVKHVNLNTPFAPVYSCSGHGKGGYFIITSGFINIFYLIDLFMSRALLDKNLVAVDIIHVEKPIGEKIPAYKFRFIGYEGLNALYSMFGAEFDKSTIQADLSVERRPSKLSATYEKKKLDNNNHRAENTIHRDRAHVAIESYFKMLADIKDGEFVPNFYFSCTYTFDEPSIPLLYDNFIQRKLLISIHDLDLTCVDVQNYMETVLVQQTAWYKTSPITLTEFLDLINSQLRSYGFKAYISNYSSTTGAVLPADLIHTSNLRPSKTFRLELSLVYEESK